MTDISMPVIDTGVTVTSSKDRALAPPEGTQVYGPFEDFTVVETPFGSFGAEPGCEMWVGIRQIWSAKHGQFVPNPYAINRLTDAFLASIPPDALAIRAAEAEASRDPAKLEKALAEMALAIADARRSQTDASEEEGSGVRSDDPD